MSEQLHPGTDTNPYSQLLGKISMVWEEYDPLEQDRRKIEEEQKAKLAKVQAEFGPRIQDAQELLAQNEAQRSTQVIREQLAELYEQDTAIGRAVIDIAVRHWWSGSADDLAQEIAARRPDLDFGLGRFSRLIEQYEGLTGLHETITNLAQGASLPVLLFNIESREYVNEQAQWEGRDSSTGRFYTSIRAVYGLASRDSVSVRHTPVFQENTITPLLHTDGVDLHLSQLVSSGQFHGRFIDISLEEQQAKVNIFGDIRPWYDLDTLMNSPLISWKNSREHLYRAERGYIEPHKHLYLQVGTGSILRAVDRLKDIKGLDHPSEQFLTEIAASIDHL